MKDRVESVNRLQKLYKRNSLKKQRAPLKLLARRNQGYSGKQIERKKGERKLREKVINYH